MRLPSIQALRAFDGVARYGSMLKAAQELNLTPSAVSHQMRLLEADLGTALLERSGKGVALTAYGRRYAAEIRKALSIIQHAPAASDSTELSGRLCISCVPGFAIFWLTNHLHDFRRRYPKLDLKIITPAQLDGVRDGEADLFIAFGTGNWPGMASELLAEIDFSPYCTPQLLAECGGTMTMQHLEHLPLLHMGSYDDWTRWLAAGAAVLDAQRGLIFSNLYLVLSAAVAGLGVAIGDDLTFHGAMEQGQLVKPFALSMRSLEAYYLVSEAGQLDRPACRAFHDWITGTLATRSIAARD